jgi:hypothetical protein
VYMLICLYPILFNLVFYKNKTNLISKIYPINIFEKVIIELIDDLTNFEYLMSLVMLFFISLFSLKFNCSYIVFSIFLILMICILINILKLFLERQLIANKFITLMIGLSSFTIVFHFIEKAFSFSTHRILFGCLFNFISLVILIFIEKFAVKRKVMFSNFLKTNVNPFFSLIWTKIETRRLILIYLVGKILMCSFLSYCTYIKGEALDSLTMSCSMLLMIPFMSLSVFVNAWGSLDKIWLLIKNNTTQKKDRMYFNIYKQTILPMIICDVVFTFSWGYVSKISDIQYYIFYLSISIFLFFGGYLSSTIFPFCHKKYPNSNVGFLTSFVFMFICAGLLLPFWNKWFLIIHIFLGVTCYYCMVNSYKRIEKRKYINYINLSKL